MKTKRPEINQKLAGENRHSEILIMADGQILVHNITPAMARVLSELNPGDAAMNRRANQKNKQ